MRVSKARLEDIDGMLSLNYKIYSQEWHVSPGYVRSILQGNPEVYNILKTDAGIKGIYSLFPLNHTNYEAILQGELEEGDLSDKILDYREPKEVYLYLISIIVDIHDPDRKKYAAALIRDIPRELKRLEDKGITVKEIGAIAISPEGESVLPRIGFHRAGLKQFDTGRPYPVFRAKPEDIVRNVILPT